ncbi:alpha/beta hydrolase [Allokutzneria sp. A3M-2-11 16]|uniref:alpha/beta fold hydrolase n=1 Tax=Allokutzneria sp. A3M-2-11 16 TaxID=2962043 RepID=UPI0020B6C549|nr:alpha/beta fold hydrolase [Allokutzneria sp. A3M-2-11 16]MCP3804717.1 alpha/beta hydrolase [Allokutzneria sp. A3M-2-11 16]
MRYKGIALAAAVTALMAGGVVIAQGQPIALSWQSCGGVWQAPRVECATIEVPIDWERPGKKIAIAVGRLKHTGSGPSRGVVLSVPGGPGGSGIMDLKEHEASFTELRRHYDVVSFDRRGLELYDHLPKACHQREMPLGAPATRAEFDELAATNRAAVRACRDGDPGKLIDRVDSADVARDMDSIRAVLGQEQLRIIANSYGGVPGSTYARLFPKRVAALVMDGTVDHVSTHDQATQERVESVKERLGAFVDWCAADTSCALHGRDVRADWRGVIDKAEREPLPVPGTDITYSSGDLQWAAGAYLTRDDKRRELSIAIDQAVKGSAKVFHDTFRQKPQGSPWLVSVECGDGMARTWRDHQDYERERKGAEAALPEFWAYLLRGSMCIGTDYPVNNARAPLTGTPLPPIMGVQSFSDGHGPGAAVAQVPGSGLIRFNGYGHTMYLTGNTCVIDHVNRYFLDGKVVSATC